jgi:capsule polysaccharide export protein KpsE/RkpR
MPPEDQNSSKSSLAMMAGMAGSKIGGGGSDLSLLAGDLLGSHSSGDLYLAVLHSRSAQEALVDQFDLTSIYGIPWLRLKLKKDEARKQLDLNTEISQERKSGVISISVIDRSPKRAAAMASAYADQLNHLLASVSTSSAGRERQFLEQRLVEVKKDLDDATNDLSQFSSKNATFDPLVQGKASVDAVATLEGELIAAESQLSGMRALYTPENSRVRTLQARVTELRKQLSTLSGHAGTGAALSSGDDASLDMPFPSLRQLPLLGAKYADLFRRAKIEETVYQVLTQQYEIAKVQEAKEIPTVRTLDRADIPLRKWGPHRLLLALIGYGAGLLIGAMWVIGSQMWAELPDNSPRKMFFSEVLEILEGLWIWKKTRWVWLRMNSILGPLATWRRNAKADPVSS